MLDDPSALGTLSTKIGLLQELTTIRQGLHTGGRASDHPILIAIDQLISAVLLNLHKDLDIQSDPKFANYAPKSRGQS